MRSPVTGCSRSGAISASGPLDLPKDFDRRQVRIEGRDQVEEILAVESVRRAPVDP
jgi:hypothetical protein